MKPKVLLPLIVLTAFVVTLLASGCGYPYPTSAFWPPKALKQTAKAMVEVKTDIRIDLAIPGIPSTHIKAHQDGDVLNVYVYSPFATAVLLEAAKKHFEEKPQKVILERRGIRKVILVPTKEGTP